MTTQKTKEETNTKEQQIMSAQLRKSASINFFNASNSAIAIVSLLGITEHGELLEQIRAWREILMGDYVKYHNSTIERITTDNVDIVSAVQYVNKSTSVESIHQYASQLSDYVRNSSEFIEVARRKIEEIKKDELAKKITKKKNNVQSPQDNNLPVIK